MRSEAHREAKKLGAALQSSDLRNNVQVRIQENCMYLSASGRGLLAFPFDLVLHRVPLKMKSEIAGQKLQL